MRPTFDVAAIRATKAAIAERGLTAAHLCAFGGWNGPHPDAATSGADWFEAWRAWNAAQGGVFDGVDWDLEGHDAGGPTASLSPALVTLVAEFSRAARAAGFAVAAGASNGRLLGVASDERRRSPSTPAEE